MSWRHQNHVIYLINHVKPSTDNLNNKYNKHTFCDSLITQNRKHDIKQFKNDLKQITSKLRKPYPLTIYRDDSSRVD